MDYEETPGFRRAKVKLLKLAEATQESMSGKVVKKIHWEAQPKIVSEVETNIKTGSNEPTLDLDTSKAIDIEPLYRNNPKIVWDFSKVRDKTVNKIEYTMDSGERGLKAEWVVYDEASFFETPGELVDSFFLDLECVENLGREDSLEKGKVYRGEAHKERDMVWIVENGVREEYLVCRFKVVQKTEED